jgi:hypothetical protein
MTCKYGRLYWFPVIGTEVDLFQYHHEHLAGYGCLDGYNQKISGLFFDVRLLERNSSIDFVVLHVHLNKRREDRVLHLCLNYKLSC